MYPVPGQLAGLDQAGQRCHPTCASDQSGPASMWGQVINTINHGMAAVSVQDQHQVPWLDILDVQSCPVSA